MELLDHNRFFKVNKTRKMPKKKSSIKKKLRKLKQNQLTCFHSALFSISINFMLKIVGALLLVPVPALFSPHFSPTSFSGMFVNSISVCLLCFWLWRREKTFFW
jgi:hypothetical protein